MSTGEVCEGLLSRYSEGEDRPDRGEGDGDVPDTTDTDDRLHKLR